MKHLKFIFLLFCSLSIMLSAQSADRIEGKDIAFHKIEIPFYKFAEYTPQASLQMPFAGYEIEDPSNWLRMAESHLPYEIDLVFTKYPEDVTTWNYNYDQLLNDRLDALFSLDSVFLAKGIKWNLVLQTQCKSMTEAKRYFHGFVVKYRPKKMRVIDDIKSPEDLHAMIKGFAVPKDSTVIEVIERHPEWKKMLVVMDWTGSMYQYGAQLVLWHKLNLASQISRTTHLVFFNDGNKKKSWQKQVGKTGGVYYTRAEDLTGVVETMEKVMGRGNGGDIPENDFEAIIKATRLLEGYESVVLIADNKSAVRDVQLIEEVNKPVHIILCGVESDKYINSDYVNLAFKTGGSLHTINEDISTISKLEQGEMITIGNMDYMNKDGELSQVARVKP